MITSDSTCDKATVCVNYYKLQHLLKLEPAFTVVPMKNWEWIRSSDMCLVVLHYNHEQMLENADAGRHTEHMAAFFLIKVSISK